MKFMVNWELHRETRAEVMKAWVALGRKGRADVGKGVKLVGRWHNSAELTGVAILESKDLSAVYRYLSRWNPFMDMTVSPVLDDEESARLSRQALADQKG
jgi:Domain of unknown function (DUF3303)